MSAATKQQNKDPKPSKSEPVAAPEKKKAKKNENVKVVFNAESEATGASKIVDGDLSKFNTKTKKLIKEQ